MRYRQSLEVEGQPAQVYEGMLVATSGFGLIISLLLLWAGIRARLLWLIVWSIGLFFASVSYIVYSMVD